MTNSDNTIRVHRVGTITFGIILVLLGVFFIINEFVHCISYRFLFMVWPLALILLGIEILNSLKRSKEKYIYDKTAIFLMMVIVIFSMIGATFSFCVREGMEILEKVNNDSSYRLSSISHNIYLVVRECQMMIMQMILKFV